MNGKLPTEPPQTLDSLLDILHHACTNRDLVFRGQHDSTWFLESSIDRGVPPDQDYSRWLSDESAIIDEFCEKARRLLGPTERIFLTRDTVLKMTVMQHFGAPTRLLDWTQSAWIAAYFACLDDDGRPGAIWWLDSTKLTDKFGAEWDRLRYPRTLHYGKNIDYNDKVFDPSVEPLVGAIFFPAVAFPRVQAQRGLFTICTRLGCKHDDVLHKMMGPDASGSIGKIIIPAKLKDQAFDHLERMGFDAVSLTYAGADRCGLRMCLDRSRCCNIL